MPMKFKPSQTVRDRNTGENVTQQFYMRNTSKEELFEYINSSNGKPKVKQKCLNELQKRGVQVVWKDK